SRLQDTICIPSNMLVSFIHFSLCLSLYFFFFKDPPTTEIYTLSLHDALPISSASTSTAARWATPAMAFRSKTSATRSSAAPPQGDRKSTRLNSSHRTISYAVFCLKKKKKKK